MCARANADHRRDVFLVTRRHDDHVGEDAQVGEVVGAVMSGPVGPDQASAVEAEDNRKVLKSDLLENLVVRALKERAVNVDNRPGAGLGHTGGERDSVTLTNADVEELVRERFANLLQLVPLAHGRGDDCGFGVAPALLENRIADGVGIRAAATRS